MNEDIVCPKCNSNNNIATGGILQKMIRGFACEDCGNKWDIVYLDSDGKIIERKVFDISLGNVPEGTGFVFDTI